MINSNKTDNPQQKAAELNEIKSKKSISIRPSALRLIPNIRTTVSGSAPERVSHDWGRKQNRRRFMEDGGRSVTPMATGFFPRPTEGQSIQSFLSSGQFSSNVELDRENAHFSISEAMISAIEQVHILLSFLSLFHDLVALGSSFRFGKLVTSILSN